jgi:hypothetical protein
MKQLQALGNQLHVEQAYARDVAGRPGQAWHEAPPTGSPPLWNTIGIVEVTAIAARTVLSPPVAAITATFRRTRSAASSGNLALWLSPQRYSTATFDPSEKPLSLSP